MCQPKQLYLPQFYIFLFLCYNTQPKGGVTVDTYLFLKKFLQEMDETFSYGWWDENNICHEETMQNFHELYRTVSLEHAVTYHMGSCIEQSLYQREYFTYHNLPTKLYALVSEKQGGTDSDFRIHCFTLIFKDNLVYHFEHASAHQRKGVYIYPNKERCFAKLKRQYNFDLTTDTKIYEIDTIPTGLSLQEFKQYAEKKPLQKQLYII